MEWLIKSEEFHRFARRRFAAQSVGLFPYDRWRTGASRGNRDPVLEIDPGSLLEIWSM
jgi:hypothetical protein